MPTFHYKAVSADGSLIEGTREGDDRAAVVGWLKAAGHVPIRADELGRGLPRLSLLVHRRHGVRLSPRELAGFTAELAAMLGAGLALERALQIMARTAEAAARRTLLEGLLGELRGGAPFSAALAARPQLFPPLYLSMVRAAEVGGDLAHGLERLAAYLERRAQLREQLLSALIYPLALLVITALSLVLILLFVVPRFAEMFEGMQAVLPLSTRVVLGASALVREWWWLGLPILGAFGLWFVRRDAGPEARKRRDALLLRLPLIGELVRRMEVARFSRSLGVLLGNGVPLLEALNLARATLGNAVLAAGVAAAADSLKAGGRLAEPLARQGLFPPRALEMVRVGEESGRLVEMLLRVADLYERETALATQRLVTVAEPALIVIMGAMVAGVVMSILLAIVSINDLPL